MNDTSLLRVKSIHVEGLFDLFNHSVKLKLDERVTILHGPNGIGKTMFLQMVNAFLKGKYGLFGQVPFKRFVLEFTDDSRVDLTPGQDELPTERAKKQPIFHLHLFRQGELVEKHDVSPDAISIAEAIASRTPWIRRIEDDLWLDDRSSEFLSAEEMISSYQDEIPFRVRAERNITEPHWLTDLRKRVTVHFIEAQRLLKFTPGNVRRFRPYSQTVFTVLDYARDLKSRINDTMAQYGQQSQTLDQSFPRRLLSTRVTPLSADEIKKKMEELDTNRSKLKEIGLLNETQGHPFDTKALDSLDNTQQSVMTLYVDDTVEKLAVLEELARRTRLLLDNVNRKFHHKQIRIDQEHSLVAEGEQRTPLPLDKLSSGEQHELVLHYDLLFRVLPNTLVLIDEPELSLHVTWQKRFLPDLLEIVAMAQFDILIATHSPFIVGDRSDLMTGLDVEPL